MSSGIPEYCTPTTSFLIHLSSTFHTCIPTPLAFLSTLLGYLSIVAWLFAQAPQLFKNYTLQSASGLSIYFLTIWFLGDTSNLFGALLTGQASWQVLLAIYYVTIDLLLICQYVWYTSLSSRANGRLGKDDESGDGGDDDSLEILISISPPEDTHNPQNLGIQATKGEDHAMDNKAVTNSQNPRSDTTRHFNEKRQSRSIIRLQKSPLLAATSPKAVLFTSMLCAVLVNASPLKPNTSNSPSRSESFNELEFVGQILSWTSTLFYLGSRLPQLYKNFVRQSTSGLSPALFIAAFFGNLFYATSILTNPLAWSSYPPFGDHGWAGPEGSNRVLWVSLAAPFWLGSAGVLMMDAAMGLQFLRYGEGRRAEIVVVKDERGRGKWRRVSGWMRGWIPSPSPARVVEEARQDERALLDREDGENSRYGST